MIIEKRPGQDILDTETMHIGFAVNIEGSNTAGFAHDIVGTWWPELINIGACEPGTVLTKDHDGIHYHALVCHSQFGSRGGWTKTPEWLAKCLDNIGTTDPISMIAIGTGLNGLLLGADWKAIKKTMEDSRAKIVLYGE
jgi:hypothetical protein